MRVHEWESTKELWLYIQLVQFDFPIVFNEVPYPAPILRKLDLSLAPVFDSETLMDNPIEMKHRKLARSHRTGPLDRELKPNSIIRDMLNKILSYNSARIPQSEEKDLLWKFRYYLTRDKKALTKFLKSVQWKDSTEEKQAVELLKVWVDIDCEGNI